jgi:hypothetical protein
MNKTLRTLLIITSFTLMFVACKRNNTDSQKTDNASIPAANTTTHIDSIATHPDAPTEPVHDGINVVKWPDGKIKMQGNYKDGKRTGEWQSFYESGKLNSDEFYTNGQNDGKVDVYYENGQKMYEGENHDGKLSGIWHYWNDKGQLVKTVDYTKTPPVTTTP